MEVRRTNSNSGVLVLLLVLVLGLVLAAVLPRTLDELKETVGALPLSDHALEAHPGDYSPDKLQKIIVTYGCTEIEAYMCPHDFKCIVLCKLYNARWIGLVCGLDGEALTCIVTGFPARYSYWVNAVDGCEEFVTH